MSSSISSDLDLGHGPNPQVKKLVSIIIPSRHLKRQKNLKHFYKPISSLTDLIQDLAKNIPAELACEVIVVCNGVEDQALIKFVQEEQRAKRIDKYCINNLNAGVARAWNIGRHLAEGDLLLYVNDDVRIGPDAIKRMSEVMREDAIIGMLGPKGALWKDGEHLRFVGEIHDEEADAIAGFCFLLRTSVFDQVGGFDNAYTPAGLEEIDMAYAVRKLRKKCLVVAGLDIQTEPAHGISAQNTTIHYLNSKVTTQDLHLRNKKYFLEKWGKKDQGQNQNQNQNQNQKLDQELNQSQEHHKIQERLREFPL
jgi:glycosyltransferase involved in cell wall biosynthesis